MTADLNEVLGAYAPEIDASEFVADLRAKFQKVTGTGETALTAGELDFLTEHGGPEAAETLGHWDELSQHRRRNEVAGQSVQHVLVSTVSAAQASSIIGMGRPQISRKLTNGQLYGIRVGHHWRIPRWQFTADGLVPGLATIVPAIPDQLHPTEVEGFMATPQDDLDGRTPVGHLCAGGNPAIVARLISALDR